MKRITAALLFFTALSAPALAETPVQRNLHSWDYVQQVAYPPAANQEAAPAVEHREPHAYYHHEPKHTEGKHHHKHHDGKSMKHAHHHHHKKAVDGKEKVKEQPKQ